MNLVESALSFALNAHAGQTRKGKNIPYILHPCEVATIVSTITEDEEVMAAAMLHDTVEDCNVDPLQIRRLFGPRVYALVMSETEDKRPGVSPEDSWKDRKEETLWMLQSASDVGVRILWLGDKLANIRSFARLKREKGDDMWNMFHQKDSKIQEWYYRSVEDALRKDLDDTDAFLEYARLVNFVFGGEANEISEQ